MSTGVDIFIDVWPSDSSITLRKLLTADIGGVLTVGLWLDLMLSVMIESEVINI